MATLLHADAFTTNNSLNAYGKCLLNQLKAVEMATADQPDPGLTVLIRTRNQAEGLSGIITDIEQQYYQGNIQLIVVDTESSDRTVQIARAAGALVVPIDQASFNYAHSLNVGFERADHNQVLCLVGHSSLTNTVTFKAATRWHDSSTVGGAFGASLPPAAATMGDRMIAGLQRSKRRLSASEICTTWQPGMMVAHRSVFNKSVWQELNGFDEACGNGGEDSDFARRMMQAGYAAAREPALSVLHGYNLNILQSIRQAHYLYRLRCGQQKAFDQSVLAFRPDLRHYQSEASAGTLGHD